MRPSLKLVSAMALGAAFAASAISPALAETRWLVCKFTDQTAKARNFYMSFDDIRSTAALFDGTGMIEGTGTNITYQALRSRFPSFTVTYNRNNGALAITDVPGTYGGTFNGECRRSLPPPGAPAG